MAYYTHYSKRITRRSDECSIGELVAWRYGGLPPGGGPASPEDWQALADSLAEGLPDREEFQQYLDDHGLEMPAEPEPLALYLVRCLHEKDDPSLLVQALEVHEEDGGRDPEDIFEQTVDEIELAEVELAVIADTIGAALVAHFSTVAELRASTPSEKSE